jgi:hypothetical protein
MRSTATSAGSFSRRAHRVSTALTSPATILAVDSSSLLNGPLLLFTHSSTPFTAPLQSTTGVYSAERTRCAMRSLGWKRGSS